MSVLSPKKRSEALIEALPYIQRYRGDTFVIKYGGSAMDDPSVVRKFLRDIVFLEAVGVNPVLVHGGGKAITAAMKAAGLEARFVNGLRVTNDKAISIVAQTLDGEVNPGIVRQITDYGGQAVGIPGSKVFRAEKLPPQPVGEGPPVDIGHVGKAASICTEAVLDAVSREVVPVISPIGASPDGVLLNINADIAAAALAKEVKAKKLIFVSDVPGILHDPEDSQSLISAVSTKDVGSLIQRKIISGGMIPKIDSALDAVAAGVGKVHIIGGRVQHSLLLEIFTDAGVGTEITA